MGKNTNQVGEMQEGLQGVYLVSTPIGNLGDISSRGLHVLQNSDLIACEDTRVTRKLLTSYHIKTPVSSYHKFSTRGKRDFLLAAAANGALSLVSDAGTPAIADPGFDLVAEARIQKIPVTAIPGPCSLINALVLSGADTKAFFYGGWTLAFSPDTSIFFVSPHKIIPSLESLIELCGGGRKCSLVREMTKIHEEVITDTLENLLAYCRKNKIRGEITAVVHSEGLTKERKKHSWEEWAAEAMKYLPTSRVAQLISKIASVPRQEVYKYVAAKHEKRQKR